MQGNSVSASFFQIPQYQYTVLLLPPFIYDRTPQRDEANPVVTLPACVAEHVPISMYTSHAYQPLRLRLLLYRRAMSQGHPIATVIRRKHNVTKSKIPENRATGYIFPAFQTSLPQRSRSKSRRAKTTGSLRLCSLLIEFLWEPYHLPRIYMTKKPGEDTKHRQSERRLT